MKIYSNKVFYLIGGPNGSGKTTIAREMIGDNPKIAFLNSDDIARERGVTPARAAERARTTALNAGVPVVSIQRQ